MLEGPPHRLEAPTRGGFAPEETGTFAYGWTVVLAHYSMVTITIVAARAVSRARQNSAMERTTTRLTRWW
jgi:hypothetical protein